jgi:CHAD domain-containing protein
VEEARRDVERRRAAPADDADALHCLRIAYKRLRYTAETFASVLPSDLASLAQPAAKFQGKLGRLHDVDMAIVSVRAARLPDVAREALLVAVQRVRADRVASYLHEAGGGAQSASPAKATA